MMIRIVERGEDWTEQDLIRLDSINSVRFTVNSRDGFYRAFINTTQGNGAVFDFDSVKSLADFDLWITRCLHQDPATRTKFIINKGENNGDE